METQLKRKIKHLLSWVGILCLVNLLCSCESYIYEQEIELEEAMWKQEDSLAFNFEIEDTTKLYDLNLDLQHSQDYSYANVYINLKVSFPDGQQRSDVISLELADRKGYWKGTCGSTTCQRRIPFMNKAHFSQVGTYSIEIKQFSRATSLDGIMSLGLKMSESKEK